MIRCRPSSSSSSRGWGRRSAVNPLRDTTETRPRHVRDTSETRPRHDRDTSETRPRHSIAGVQRRARVGGSRSAGRHGLAGVRRPAAQTLPRHFRAHTPGQRPGPWRCCVVAGRRHTANMMGQRSRTHTGGHRTGGQAKTDRKATRRRIGRHPGRDTIPSSHARQSHTQPWSTDDGAHAHLRSTHGACALRESELSPGRTGGRTGHRAPYPMSPHVSPYLSLRWEGWRRDVWLATRWLSRRDGAEMEPRWSRDAAEMEPRCRRDGPGCELAD